MATIQTNNKGFLIIKMNGYEASSIGFGVEVTGCLNVILCGACNAQIEDKDIYYIAGINEVLCEDCINDFIKNMSKPNDIDSIKYEINHFNIIAQKLNMPDRASLSPDNKIIISV